MCYLHDQPGWQKSVVRLLDVFVDGLRVKAGVDRPTTRKPRGTRATPRTNGPRPQRSRKSRN